jgi:hypothetical protein
MLDAPQQDWSAYDAKVKANDRAWLRGLTPGDRFTLYEDLFNIIYHGRDKNIDLERLEQWRWQQKVADRLRIVDALQSLDALRERSAKHHTG